MKTFAETIISQYANSPTLGALIANMNAYIDPGANLDAFYDFVWNVETAVGCGLDVWGRIVVIGRVLQLPVVSPSFRFFETGTDATPFGVASFYAGPPGTMNFSLSDTAYRTLILAKALANIFDGSIPSINQILLNLFPNRGNCFVTDGENMTMTYTFTFALTAVEQAILQQSGVLPTPAGVAASVVIL